MQELVELALGSQHDHFVRFVQEDGAVNQFAEHVAEVRQTTVVLDDGTEVQIQDIVQVDGFHGLEQERRKAFTVKRNVYDEHEIVFGE